MTALLFAGQDYEPAGGWHDLVDQYPTIDQAMATANDWSWIRRTEASVWWMDPGSILFASTNLGPVPTQVWAIGERIGRGTITQGPDGNGRWLVEEPAREERQWRNDWAHIVVDGQIVATWRAGEWSHETTVEA